MVMGAPPWKDIFEGIAAEVHDGSTSSVRLARPSTRTGAPPRRTVTRSTSAEKGHLGTADSDQEKQG